ncbi:MFS transporter [Methylophaga thiooxydans]|uniref:Transporter, major facilitator family n=1 Tax=Methylophaga thiooxydans DMS010 TaxID=637616 RepID=C0N5M8_9GAMM|nr:MFS transporter [Methylophaga thiooxydans]EEF79812.1 transporter, major facilitator family [Methylophaga thiooxydans DMS010]
MTQKQTATTSMTALEKRSISGLSLIFALRMLGLFMILPVFSLSAQQYSGSTPMLIGLAIGAYGLTQALLQIPFGMLSDRIGRKRVITIGLLLFAAGSAVAAMAETIEMVIAGRLLQGSGAIAAAVMALTADLTRDEQRTKAMASIGISIGLSFSIALATGAALEHWIGLSGIFWATALLAIIGLVVLHYWVPTPHRCVSHRDIEPVPKQFIKVLKNPQIMRMVISIMVLHLLLTTSFFALPLALQNGAGLDKSQHALIYLPILLVAFITMVPFIIIAEKKRKMKAVFIGAIATLGIAELGWALMPNSLVAILFSLWLFFTAFNILEASLPSLMSKLSPLENKGTAMGIYSSAQFIGAFIGGALGGSLYTRFGLEGIFGASAILIVFWLILIVPMQAPRHFSSRIIHLNNSAMLNTDHIVEQLNAIKGVKETIVVLEEQVAYVKFSPEETDLSELEAFAFQN